MTFVRRSKQTVTNSRGQDVSLKNKILNETGKNTQSKPGGIKTR